MRSEVNVIPPPPQVRTWLLYWEDGKKNFLNLYVRWGRGGEQNLNYGELSEPISNKST